MDSQLEVEIQDDQERPGPCFMEHVITREDSPERTPSLALTQPPSGRHNAYSVFFVPGFNFFPYEPIKDRLQATLRLIHLSLHL